MKFNELISRGNYSDFSQPELSRRLWLLEETVALEQQYPQFSKDESAKAWRREHTFQTALSIMECSINRDFRDVADGSYEFLLRYADSGEKYAELINAVTRASSAGWARRIVGDAKAALIRDCGNRAISGY